MSKHDETLQRAFGHIPKELPGTNFSFDIIPFRGIRYYWLLLVRKFTR
jgi:hypothetical protein